MSVMIKNEDILEANQLWENIQYTEQSGEKVNAGDIKKIQKNVIDQNLDMDIILQQQLINTSPSLRMEYQESIDQWPSTQQSYSQELWQQLPCCIQRQIIDKIKENPRSLGSPWRPLGQVTPGGPWKPLGPQVVPRGPIIL